MITLRRDKKEIIYVNPYAVAWVEPDGVEKCVVHLVDGTSIRVNDVALDVAEAVRLALRKYAAEA